MRTKMFFYINNEKKKQIRKSFISILICISMTLSIYITKQRIYPLVISTAKSNASQEVTLIVNKEVLQLIKDMKITYKDIVDKKREERGSIVSLETNTVELNKIKSTLAYNIQNSVSNISKTDIGIPIGNLTGSLILTGRGPKIPVRLTSVGNIVVDIHDEFISAGINQTKHMIDADVKMSVDIALPNSMDKVEIKTRVPLAETIIVGNVPSMYLGK